MNDVYVPISLIDRRMFTWGFFLWSCAS